MKEFNCAQNSPEWSELRAGVPTASEFGQLLTSEFALRTGEMPKTYLYRKVAEFLTGPLPNYSGSAMDQGHFLEPEAVALFELETGLDTRRVGFVMADGGRCGCSPDALIGPAGAVTSGVEIKSPGAVNHIRYLLEGKLPDQYAPQVYGSMFVTGVKEWRFMSYHRKLPPLLLTIERDEEIMGKIGAALTRFYTAFDAAVERIEPTKKAA